MQQDPWSTVAFYCVAGGIAGAVITAVPGLIDYFSIDEAQMRRIATYHLESTLVLCWFSRPNLWIRLAMSATGILPLVLSVIGVVGIGIGAWLGGEMVYVKGKATSEPSRRSSPSGLSLST